MSESSRAKLSNAKPITKSVAKSGDKPGPGIQVIARAASILRELENEHDGLSLGQIAKRVDLPRSTVQRIVGALTEEHLLIGASLNARVKLGPAILRMAANTSFDFTDFVRPHLESLAQITGETVDLSVRRGKKMIFVDQIAANQRLSAVSSVGESFLMHSSANGKAALSLLDDQQIEKLFSDGLPKETANTVASLRSLLKEISAVRKTHIAFDNEEHTEGISAVGTAFLDPMGRSYAVSVPVPTIRFVKSKSFLKKTLLGFREDLLASLD